MQRKNIITTSYLLTKSTLAKSWKIINYIIGRGNNKNKVSNKFMHNDKIITDPKQIATQFNHFFVNLACNLSGTSQIAHMKTKDICSFYEIHSSIISFLQVFSRISMEWSII